MGLLAALGLPKPRVRAAAARAAQAPARAPARIADEEPLSISTSDLDDRPSPPPGKPAKAPAPKRKPKTVAELRALAQWPDDAHRAWKSLTGPERLGLLEHMGRRYGTPFAQAFLEATKGKTRLTAQHFVPALAHQVPEWFAGKGYKLAQRSTYQEWWVHPDGHQIYLVLESTPKELKDALARLLKAIEKADADYNDVSLMGLALDKFNPMPVYPKDPLAAFEAYLAKLGELETFIDAEMEAAAKARAALVKKGIGVSEFDAEVARLADDQWRVKKRLEDEQLDELDPRKGDDDSKSDDAPPTVDDAPPIDYSGGDRP